MEDFEMTIAINGQQIAASVHPHVEGDSTYYDIVTDDFTISLYKDTMYTWAADVNAGFSNEEIQTIGEQLLDY